VTYDLLEEGSVQWPCNDANPDGSPVMHVDGFVRGKGKFIRTEYVATDERTGPRFPLLLTTGRILSQYNVGAQTRRTENTVWHEEDLLEIHPHDAEQRGIREGDWSSSPPARARRRCARHHRPGQPRRGLHHLPPPEHAGQCDHHRFLRLGHQLPGIQGDGGAGVALQRPDRVAAGLRGPSAQARRIAREDALEPAE
jgi:formate dehydrogenase major subunit